MVQVRHGMRCCSADEGCEDTCKCNPVAHNPDVASRAAHAPCHRARATGDIPTQCHGSTLHRSPGISRYREMVGVGATTTSRALEIWCDHARSSDGEITGILRARLPTTSPLDIPGPSAVAFGVRDPHLTCEYAAQRRAAVVIREFYLICNTFLN